MKYYLYLYIKIKTGLIEVRMRVCHTFVFTLYNLRETKNPRNP